MTIPVRIALWMSHQGGSPSDRKPVRPLKINASALAKRLNCERVSIQNALREMAEEGIIKQVAPSKRGPYGHAGVWLLLHTPQSHDIIHKHYWTPDLLYWMARKHPGTIDLQKLSDTIGVTRSAIREALWVLQKDGVISWERLGTRWNIGRLHAVRRYDQFHLGRRAERNRSEDQHPDEFWAALRRLHETVSVRNSGKTFSSPPGPPPSLLTTTTTTLGTKSTGSSTTRDALPGIPWRLEVADVVSDLMRTARRLDPLTDLPEDPYHPLYQAAHPAAFARLRGLEMEEKGRTGSANAATRRVLRSTGAKTAAKMPKSTPDRQQTTLYRVGTAKLAALLEGFRLRKPTYAVSREDNEAVRSPKIGWHCEAWVEAYVGGNMDYDRYGLEFDAETDQRFTTWRAGLRFAMQNEAIWQQFWALVACEVEDITGAVWDEKALRTIENWVSFGGDYLAEQIGHKQGPEAWLEAGRVLGQWFFWPMHDDLRGDKPRLTSDQWKWVTLFAIGFAQKNCDLLGSHLREPVLTSLAAMRYQGAWGLSAGMQVRLGLGEDMSALKDEGAALLSRHANGIQDTLNAPATPTFHLMFTEALKDPSLVREIYDQAGGPGELPELFDFGIEASTMKTVSPFSREYFEQLAEYARRRGDEEALALLIEKAELLRRHEEGERLDIDDAEVLAQSVPGYDTETKPMIEWMLVLFGTTNASGEPQDAAKQ